MFCAKRVLDREDLLFDPFYDLPTRHKIKIPSVTAADT